MIKIKICGLFQECDIDYVNEAKPDYIGFVFAESRRRVSFEKAKAMRSKLEESITPVGVFVNAPAPEIVRMYQEGIISMAQLHGNESEAYINALQHWGVAVIKAVPVETAGDILKWRESNVDYLLLDHGTGGSGKIFDWTLIPQMEKPYFVAGGIHEENLRDATALHPYGVDISSGVEVNGVKSRDKILRLVEKARMG